MDTFRLLSFEFFAAAAAAAGKAGGEGDGECEDCEGEERQQEVDMVALVPRRRLQVRVTQYLCSPVSARVLNPPAAIRVNCMQLLSLTKPRCPQVCAPGPCRDCAPSPARPCAPRPAGPTPPPPSVHPTVD